MVKLMYTSRLFFTKIAQSYASYASTKNAYLSAINRFITRETKEAERMIDIGSGDGKRSTEIAKSIKVSNLTLVDNSPGMISLLEKLPGVSVVCRDISDEAFELTQRFDIVTCLWNVLGHIPTPEKRKIAIKNMKKLAMPGGFIYLDVNNRYNTLQYGLPSVAKNVFWDTIEPNSSNGDFELEFKTKEEIVKTEVHIFSPFEMNELLKSAGLRIVKKQIINYQTGNECKSILGGQLVYKLSKL